MQKNKYLPIVILIIILLLLAVALTVTLATRQNTEGEPTDTPETETDPGEADTPEPHEHLLGIRISRAPTCTEYGVEEVYCLDCGESIGFRDVLPTGHSFSDWRTVTVSNCTIQGKRQRTCKVCQETETERHPALGHDYDANHICTRCGETDPEFRND